MSDARRPLVIVMSRPATWTVEPSLRESDEPYMSSGVLDERPRQRFEVVSPELALVDPELGRVARALLPDCAEHAVRARLHSAVSTGAGSSLAPVEPVVRDHERPSRRVLVGVAAVTMLALLLFDVRVRVGERPAAADSSPIRGTQQPYPDGTSAYTLASVGSPIHQEAVPSQRPEVRVGSGSRRVRLPRRVLQGSPPRVRNGHERAVRDSPGKVDVWGDGHCPFEPVRTGGTCGPWSTVVASRERSYRRRSRYQASDPPPSLLAIRVTGRREFDAHG